MKKTILSLACLSILLVQSCKKDEAESPQPTPTNTIVSVNVKFEDGEFAPSDGNGSFAAIHTVNTFVGFSNDSISEINAYSAFGAFFGSNVGTYVDGGNVVLNSKDTLQNVMGTYFLSSLDNIIQGGNNWTISGNTSTGIPAFTFSAGTSFPTFNLWNIKSEYTKTAGISITLPSDFKNTDSVILLIQSSIQPEKRVMKLVSPKSRVLSFTSPELATIPRGQISIQVTAIKMFATVSNNKKFYFFNEYQRGANATLI